MCVIHLLQLFWHSSSQCLWPFVSCFGRIYYFPRHRLIEAWETYRNPFRNHNSPEPGRERFVSSNGRERAEVWGHTHTDKKRFQSSGGQSETDHKKVCKWRSESETSAEQTWFIHTQRVKFVYVSFFPALNSNSV